jgi:hypothetical protein
MQPVERLGMFLLTLALLATVAGALSAHPGLDVFSFARALLNDFYANLSTELASIAVTILIIDRMHQHHDDQREHERLVLQMGSPDNGFAIEAVRLLSAQGWLHNGGLAGAHLSHANLENADLHRVNLQGARLGMANLRHTLLNDSDLRGANLQGANLENGMLAGANLRGTNLNDANLQGARLTAETLLDGQTVLPDLTFWSPGTDLHRFTDVNHAEFWRSHHSTSPAFRTVHSSDV